MDVTFYDRCEALANEQNITFYKIAKESGITGAAITSWKKNESVPKADIAVKVAALLHTSTEYLVTWKNKDELTPDDTKLLETVHQIKPEFRYLVQDCAEALASKELTKIIPPSDKDK